MNIFKIIKKARQLAKEEAIANKEISEKSAIAKLFNDRYTYRYKYFKTGEQLPGSAMYSMNPTDQYAWMCPVCNQIHRPVESSMFSGLQYPKCCNHGMGNRLYDKIKTS